MSGAAQAPPPDSTNALANAAPVHIPLPSSSLPARTKPVNAFYLELHPYLIREYFGLSSKGQRDPPRTQAKQVFFRNGIYNTTYGEKNFEAAKAQLFDPVQGVPHFWQNQRYCRLWAEGETTAEGKEFRVYLHAFTAAIVRGYRRHNEEYKKERAVVWKEREAKRKGAVVKKRHPRKKKTAKVEVAEQTMTESPAAEDTIKTGWDPAEQTGTIQWAPAGHDWTTGFEPASQIWAPQWIPMEHTSTAEWKPAEQMWS